MTVARVKSNASNKKKMMMMKKKKLLCYQHHVALVTAVSKCKVHK